MKYYLLLSMLCSGYLMPSEEGGASHTDLAKETESFIGKTDQEALVARDKWMKQHRATEEGRAKIRNFHDLEKEKLGNALKKQEESIDEGDTQSLGLLDQHEESLGKRFLQYHDKDLHGVDLGGDLGVQYNFINRVNPVKDLDEVEDSKKQFEAKKSEQSSQQQSKKETEQVTPKPSEQESKTEETSSAQLSETKTEQSVQLTSKQESETEKKLDPKTFKGKVDDQSLEVRKEWMKTASAEEKESLRKSEDESIDNEIRLIQSGQFPHIQTEEHKNEAVRRLEELRTKLKEADNPKAWTTVRDWLKKQGEKFRNSKVGKMISGTLSAVAGFAKAGFDAAHEKAFGKKEEEKHRDNLSRVDQSSSSSVGFIPGGNYHIS